MTELKYHNIPLYYSYWSRNLYSFDPFRPSLGVYVKCIQC